MESRGLDQCRTFSDSARSDEIPSRRAFAYELKDFLKGLTDVITNRFPTAFFGLSPRGQSQQESEKSMASALAARKSLLRVVRVRPWATPRKG